MSEAKIDEAGLRALCEAATPGPWEATGLAEYEHVNYEPRPDNIVDSASGIVAETSESNRDEADARFIVAARTAVPALLDLVKELRTERDEAVRVGNVRRAEYLDVADSLLPESNGPADLVAEVHRLRRAVETRTKERDEARAKLAAPFPCGWPEPFVSPSHGVNRVVWEAVSTALSPDEAEGIGAKLIEMAGVARRGG